MTPAPSKIPPLARPALEALREYMHGLYPGRRDSDPFPLEFWRIEDDELFLEAIGYLPLHMGLTDTGEVPHLQSLPEGFRLAFPIFWLEDDYQTNGWTTLTNAGDWLLPSAIAAFDRIGMSSEARALEAALKSCRRSPDDDEAAEAAYKSVDNIYSEDDKRFVALLAFFRSNAHLFEESTR